MKKITIIAIILFSFLIITNVNAEEVVFERVGKYAIATAGNNNSNRGTSYEAADYSLILDYPSNWNEIKQNIPQNIQDKINNISGSYLEYIGEVKSAWLTYFWDQVEEGDEILVIYPDKSYSIHKVSIRLGTLAIDIDMAGAYYVAFLDAKNTAVDAWAISAVYENEDITINYMKIINVDVVLRNGANATIYFSSKLPLLGEYQVYGVIPSGGKNGWDVEGKSEDTIEALFNDGTSQYLYEDTYNGKVIFEGRFQYDFINDTFNTKRTHIIQGGEMDIFNETLSSDYFGGKELIGYHFTKIGTDSYYIALIGLSQSVESPDLKTESDISKNEDNSVHINVKVKNTTEWEACNTELRIKIDEHLNINSIKNVSYNYDVNYAIDYTNREVVIIFNEQLANTKDFEINFDVEIEIYGNISLSTSLNYYPSLNHVCENDITSDSAYQINNTSSSILVLLNNVNNDLVNPQTGTMIPFLIILGFGFLGFGLYKYARNKRLV